MKNIYFCSSSVKKLQGDLNKVKHEGRIHIEGLKIYDK